MPWKTLNVVLVSVLVFCGCDSSEDRSASGDSAAESSSTTSHPKLTVTSSAFGNNEEIPKRHTADGENLSPPLAWSPGPAGTKSFAVTCTDPDAFGETWAHWILSGLSPDKLTLDDGVVVAANAAADWVQGENDFGEIGYGGPAPPPGPAHQYVFRVFALDSVPQIDAQSLSDFEEVIDGHILASGSLTGTFGRKKDDSVE